MTVLNELHKANHAILNGLGGGTDENLRGWDKIDAKLLTPSRKRWVRTT